MGLIATTSSDIAGPRRRRGSSPRLVRAGFIPLVDASVLIAAAEMGFAEREGVRLELIKDVSWANIRDRLAFRQFDVTHMLSPMPIASRLGLGSNPYPVVTPFSLGRGGNAITLSLALYREMEALGGLAGDESAIENAIALRAVLERRRAAGAPLPTFAMTYPFSSHNYELRYWLGAAGIHPDRDVRLVVVPPPLTADALAVGAIDGFCVGAPWNMVAVEAGVGRIVATKMDLWPSSPEKVIGTRPDWVERNPETLSRLIVALDAAARWCDALDNRPALAEILAAPRYIGTPVHILRRVLLGEFVVDPRGAIRTIPDFFVFHRDAANFPWISQALWIYSQMVRWGQAALTEEGKALAASAYRPDLYRQALGPSGADLPAADTKTEGAPDGGVADAQAGGTAIGTDMFLDGRMFRPEQLEDYVDAFEVHSRDGSAEATFDR